MNDIHAHNEGDAQARLFDGNVLQGTYLVNTLQVEHTAQLATGNEPGHFCVLCLTGSNIASHLQVQLTDFLL